MSSTELWEIVGDWSREHAWVSDHAMDTYVTLLRGVSRYENIPMFWLCFLYTRNTRKWLARESATMVLWCYAVCERKTSLFIVIIWQHSKIQKKALTCSQRSDLYHLIGVIILWYSQVNVGGKNKVEMCRLKDLFETLSFKSVQTYINSGNVVFQCARERMEASESEVISQRVHMINDVKVCAFELWTILPYCISHSFPKCSANRRRYPITTTLKF